MPDSDPYDAQGLAEVNGVSYPNALGAEFCGTSERKWTYVLSRKYASVRGTIGLSDNSLPAVSVRFTVLADGKQVYSKDLTVGHSVTFNVPVTNALQLELDSTLLTQVGGCGGVVTAEWANMYAVGP